MAAERACELSDKPARVVPATSQQASLLALVELDPEATLEENAERLEEALDGVATGGVAPAARDDAQGRFKKGDAVGFVDGEIVAWGGAGSTLTQTLEQLAEGAEIVTLIAGEGAPIAARRDRHPRRPTGSRSRPTRGDSRAGGGCWPPSSARPSPAPRELGRAELLDAPVHWPRPSVLEHGLGALKGVGPKTAEAAAEAGIRTVGDLLFHIPSRHRDLRIRELADVEPGETATVRSRS